MQIKHTLYFDGENRTFEGKIVDDDGLKFESNDIDEFMAAVELFHDNGYTLAGIDMMPLEDKKTDDCDGCSGDCDCCDCEDPDCTKCCDERDECDDEWEFVELDDDEVKRRIFAPAGPAKFYQNNPDFAEIADKIEELDAPVVKTIHIHSIELLAMAAAGIGLWKLAKKLFRR